MICNLKVLLTVAMALAAFGAFSATAHATEEFHCSVEPCRWTLNPDGTGTSAHQVLVIKNKSLETSSVTATSLSGEATSATKTTGALTFTHLAYSGVKLNGFTAINIRMNACTYTFLGKSGSSAASIEIKCPESKHIEIENTGTKCIFEITPQTLSGAKYHNIGTPGTSSTEMTIEMFVQNIVVEVGSTGTGCIPNASKGDVLTGEITTGNLIATAEKDNSEKEMIEGWWA